MMNSHIQYAANTMHQKDVLARSARRRLVRSLRCQERLARQAARNAQRPPEPVARPLPVRRAPVPARAAARACCSADIG
jgi:hypothetical protein